jgi:hypothetical protein
MERKQEIDHGLQLIILWLGSLDHTDYGSISGATRGWHSLHGSKEVMAGFSCVNTRKPGLWAFFKEISQSPDLKQCRLWIKENVDATDFSEGLFELRASNLNHSTNPFFVMGFFWDRVSWAICLGWLQTRILLISAFWVDRIIGMSHQCGALTRRF